MSATSHSSALAVVIGVRGGIGTALLHALRAAAARHIAARGLPLRLVVNATGALDRHGCVAE
jgi:hypothetical protein